MKKLKPVEIREYRYVRSDDVQPDDTQSETITKRCVALFEGMKALLDLDDVTFARDVKRTPGWTPAEVRAYLRRQLDEYGPSTERTVAVGRKLNIDLTMFT
jgi:hypothetical protein